MKNKAAKQRGKRKGAKDSAFACDLGEYLHNSSQDVPQVLKSCAEFIEEHGIVDGVYRHSGITSNIQKLRQEFGTEQLPDLTKEVYLQDIHCVGSLCKLYFRELPNPLLTYELYKKFTEAVAAQSEEEQLEKIQNVIKELPPPHYRTLEYLSKHLTHIASFSGETNMHSRNLALVWAPNLLRSKEIEGSGYNNDAAFLEVRVQSIVIEFILNHVHQLFNSNATQIKQDVEAHNPVAKCKSLPIVSPSMKLLSLEEAQARTLKPDHPARLEKIHSAPMNTGPAAGTIYHTVIDLPDPRRKLSAKTKKWKSIFNLGRLGNDSKGKISRNGSVFVRAPPFAEKGNIRPAKSMESLCSLPLEDDEKGVRFKHGAGLGGGLSASMKSHTLGSGGSFNLSRRHSDWDQEELVGAIGGCVGNISPGASDTEPEMLRVQPEQLKVFCGDAFSKSEPSPKTRRLFYSANFNDSSPKSNFPGNLFPLEASPRHRRKPMAVNISEPFSISVPLHISGVITPSATPCKEDAQHLNETGSQESMDRPSPAESSTFHNASEERGDLRSGQTDSHQHEQKESVTISSPTPCESTEQEEVPPPTVPSAENPCENEHQSGSMKEHPATKQDADCSAKLFMEHLRLQRKELEIVESEETTGPGFFPEKTEEKLVQSRDDNQIEYMSLPDAPTAVNITGQQRMHSLPNLFLHSSMVETAHEEMDLISTSNKCSGDGKDTKSPDHSQTQDIKSLESLQDASSKMEFTQPITDQNTSKVIMETPPTECFAASPDSGHVVDINSDVKHQYSIGSHEFQSSEPCIKKSGPSSKSDNNFTEQCPDVLHKVTVHSTHNLSHERRDQEEHLADVQSGLKAETLTTDASEFLSPKHWMDNDAFKEPNSPSIQRGKVKEDEEECLAKMSPDIRPEEWRYAAQDIWSPDVCTDKVSPDEPSQSSSQSVDQNIDWISQNPETALSIGNDESFSNRSLVTKSATFLNEMEGTCRQSQQTVASTEDSSLASSKLDSLYVGNFGASAEPTMVTPGAVEEGRFASDDKTPLYASYSTVNSQPSVSDESPVHSFPVGVTAVRTTYMIKTCQVKAIPVIPPKVQFTQVPRPLPKKSLPLDKVLTVLQPVEPSWPDSKQRLDPIVSNSSPAESKDGKENGRPKSQSPEHGRCVVSPDTSLIQSKPSQAAPGVKKTSKANGEEVPDSPPSLRTDRSVAQQKPGFMRHPQHRSKASRPQSLILFSSPWPSMERSSPAEPSRAPLSPVKSSPEPRTTSELDHSAPGSYAHEPTDSQNGLEGVTLRNHMTMPKSGQRLETSTSCFYQPQRRSMIFENRGGRQIE
ncbi:rho GTPase-activating protein 31 isoform X2 [Rhinoraja longicauda]